MKSKIKILILLTMCFVLIVTSYHFVTSYKEHATKEVVSSVSDVIDLTKTEDVLAVNKIKELRDYYGNDDIKGIITIDGIDKFNYPIVQSNDNNYYLDHNYYREYDSYGAIYADYRINLDNSRKVLIFGHSSTKRNVPFNELENYENKDFYNKHKYITIETETNIYRYEIFSVHVETKDFTYMNINFDNMEDWYSHILKLKIKSNYLIDAELNKDDEILILQTCSNNSKYQKNSKKYLLIVSRRVK